jgi:hypothetical protein
LGALLNNLHHRELIEHEFTRRLLVLPRPLAAGETVTASCFFRVSPGPRHLIVHYRVGDAAAELTLPLKGLSGLHFLRRDYPLDTVPPPLPK